MSTTTHNLGPTLNSNKRSQKEIDTLLYGKSQYASNDIQSHSRVIHRLPSSNHNHGNLKKTASAVFSYRQTNPLVTN